MGDVWRALSRLLPVRLHRWRRPGVRHAGSVVLLQPYTTHLPQPHLQPSSQPQAIYDHHGVCTASAPLPGGGDSNRQNASL